MLSVEMVDPSALTPDPDNVRDHPERQIAALEESLRTFGQRRPLVVSSEYVVAAGNGTLEAVSRLGWDEVAVTVLPSDWPLERVRAYAIADNRSAELSDWDTDALLLALEDDSIAELTSGVGFSESDLIDLYDLRDHPFTTMRLPITDLKPHPRNYQEHPESQLDQIEESLRANGFYRNVVVARDNTILAGHGVILAVTRMGGERVPVVRLDLDPDDPRALKVMTSDNEINNLAITDDRALTELLKDILHESEDIDPLFGSGYTEEQLTALAFTTTHESELADKAAAAEWVGMPDYDEETPEPKLMITFTSDDDRDEFVSDHELNIRTRGKKVWSTVWPWQDRYDLKSVRFVEEPNEA